jgi:hypothetical protein
MIPQFIMVWLVLAKNVFQAHEYDALARAALRKTLRSNQVLTLFFPAPSRWKPAPPPNPGPSPA